MDIRTVPNCALTPAIVSAYEDVLGAPDRRSFESAVESTLAQVAPSARFYMFESDENAAIHLRVARCEPQIEASLGHYLQYYRAEDPLDDALQMLDQSEVVLMRVAPENIRQDGFREHFFYKRDIVERVSLVQRTACGWRGMNISRHKDHGLCSDRQLSDFATLAQLLLPMMTRHWTRLPVATQRRQTIPQLESRFEELYPQLTARERQVCARAAAGVSVEGTALDLGVTVSSVITYRRRAYARLRVSGSYELAGLVMH